MKFVFVIFCLVATTCAFPFMKPQVHFPTDASPMVQIVVNVNKEETPVISYPNDDHLMPLPLPMPDFEHPNTFPAPEYPSDVLPNNGKEPNIRPPDFIQTYPLPIPEDHELDRPVVGPYPWPPPEVGTYPMLPLPETRPMIPNEIQPIPMPFPEVEHPIQTFPSHSEEEKPMTRPVFEDEPSHVRPALIRNRH